MNEITQFIFQHGGLFAILVFSTQKWIETKLEQLGQDEKDCLVLEEGVCDCLFQLPQVCDQTHVFQQLGNKNFF